MAIGLMFLFYVRKLIFTPDQLTGSEVGKKIGWFLLAWVLIQASWFMMGALLDIEKITTSAMGALPGLVIQDDNSRWQKMVGAMWDSGIQWQILQLKEEWTPTALVFNKDQTALWINTSPESTLDAILPSHNTLSWPLYFIWFSIFQFQEYSKVSVGTDYTLKDLSWLFTSVGIKFLVLAAFVIMMLMLFIINIIRIAYLWMIIALAPLIVLYIVLKDVLGMEMWSAQDGIMSKINVKTILAYIFQPTIIITFMGLILIAVTALWQGMDGSTTTVVSEYGFTISTGGVEHATFELQTKGDLFNQIGDTSKGIFRNLIILWLVFALLIGLIVLSASSMKVTFIENMAKWLGKALIQVPFIPVYSAGWAANNIVKDVTWINLTWQNAGKLDIAWHNALNEWFGEAPIGGKVDDKYISELNSNMSNPIAYIQSLQKYRDKKWETWLAMNAQWLLPSITQFIKKNNDSDRFKTQYLSNLDSTWLTDEQKKNFKKEDLYDYLKHGKNANNLYKVIMGVEPTTTNEVTAKDIAEWRLILKNPVDPKK